MYKTCLFNLLMSICVRNKTTVVSTSGNDTIKENITNVFGPKQVCV